jgi:hypothetical protein
MLDTPISSVCFSLENKACLHKRYRQEGKCPLLSGLQPSPKSRHGDIRTKADVPYVPRRIRSLTFLVGHFNSHDAPGDIRGTYVLRGSLRVRQFVPAGGPILPSDSLPSFDSPPSELDQQS